MRQRTPPVVDPGKDVAALLDQALEAAGITQYELAKRMAEARETHLSSQDQALRRIRKQGQTPTEEVAVDIARAFAPELELADDYFFTPRTQQAAQLREAALAALEETAQLRERLEALEAEVERLKRRKAAPRAR